MSLILKIRGKFYDVPENNYIGEKNDLFFITFPVLPSSFHIWNLF